MELNHLRTFVTVAEEGHLTRAADRLCISQPALSGHIKALEGELGVALFQRTPRGMTLTREGEKLIDRARGILDDARILVGEARSMRGELNGRIRLGINTDSDFLRLGAISARLRREYPAIALSLVNSNSADIQRDVRRGELDAGFVYGRMSEAGLDGHLLAQVPFCVVGPVAWRERLETADWSAIAAMPWIWVASNCPFLDILGERFRACGQEPLKKIVADHEDILRALAIAGEGLTLMRQDDAREADRRGLLTVWPGDVPALPLFLVTVQTRDDEPVLRAACDVIRLVWAE